MSSFAALCFHSPVVLSFAPLLAMAMCVLVCVSVRQRFPRPAAFLRWETSRRSHRSGACERTTRWQGHGCCCQRQGKNKQTSSQHSMCVIAVSTPFITHWFWPALSFFLYTTPFAQQTGACKSALCNVRMTFFGTML